MSRSSSVQSEELVEMKVATIKYTWIAKFGASLSIDQRDVLQPAARTSHKWNLVSSSNAAASTTGWPPVAARTALTQPEVQDQRIIADQRPEPQRTICPWRWMGYDTKSQCGDHHGPPRLLRGVNTTSSSNLQNPREVRRLPAASQDHTCICFRKERCQAEFL